MIAAGKRRGARALRTVLIAIGCLVLLGAFSGWLQDQRHDLAQLNAWLQSHRVALSLCRTALVLFVIWRWHRIAHWLYPAQTEQALRQRQLFTAQRWRLLGTFAFIEIVLANHLFATLVGAVT
jgi:hypothetical protein